MPDKATPRPRLTRARVPDLMGGRPTWQNEFSMAQWLRTVALACSQSGHEFRYIRRFPDEVSSAAVLD